MEAGEPGYVEHLDADGDGVACEPVPATDRGTRLGSLVIAALSSLHPEVRAESTGGGCWTIRTDEHAAPPSPELVKKAQNALLVLALHHPGAEEAVKAILGAHGAATVLEVPASSLPAVVEGISSAQPSPSAGTPKTPSHRFFAPSVTEVRMQFRLTYDGPLYSTGNDKGDPSIKRADHSHEVRLRFHSQLSYLWRVTPFLRTGERSGPGVLLRQGPDFARHDAESVAKRHQQGHWSFVPLVTQELRALCSLNILFLRDSPAAQVITSGDLDGRLKNLLDCLSMPTPGQRYPHRTAEDGANPLFVLLQDDSLISKVSVEADRLLDRRHKNLPKAQQDSHVQLVITVDIRLYDPGLDNIQFA